MTYVAAAWVSIAVGAAVLMLGTYYRGGAECLRQNARPIATLLLGAIVLVSILTVANLVAGT